MHSYLDALDEELTTQPGFKKPPEREVSETRTTSTTDPEAGYIHHGVKRGVGYLAQITVDCKHGIVTGMDVYPANEKGKLDYPATSGKTGQSHRVVHAQAGAG